MTNVYYKFFIIAFGKYLLHTLIAITIAFVILLFPNNGTYITDVGPSGLHDFILITFPIACIYYLIFLISWTLKIIEFFKNESKTIKIRLLCILLIFIPYIFPLSIIGTVNIYHRIQYYLAEYKAEMKSFENVKLNIHGNILSDVTILGDTIKLKTLNYDIKSEEYFYLVDRKIFPITKVDNYSLIPENVRIKNDIKQSAQTIQVDVDFMPKEIELEHEATFVERFTVENKNGNLNFIDSNNKILQTLRNYFDQRYYFHDKDLFNSKFTKSLTNNSNTILYLVRPRYTAEFNDNDKEFTYIAEFTPQNVKVFKIKFKYEENNEIVAVIKVKDKIHLITKKYNLLIVND